MANQRHKKEAELAGRQAYEDGYPSGANPHNRMGVLYGCWLEGWYAQKTGR